MVGGRNEKIIEMVGGGGGDRRSVLALSRDVSYPLMQFLYLLRSVRIDLIFVGSFGSLTSYGAL